MSMKLFFFKSLGLLCGEWVVPWYLWTRKKKGWLGLGWWHWSGGNLMRGEENKAHFLCKESAAPLYASRNKCLGVGMWSPLSALCKPCGNSKKRSDSGVIFVYSGLKQGKPCQSRLVGSVSRFVFSLSCLENYVTLISKSLRAVRQFSEPGELRVFASRNC